MRRRTITCIDRSVHSLANSGPVSIYESVSIPTFSESQQQLFHELWNELHTKADPDAAWFATWRARVPSFSGCGCGEFLDGYCVGNPPKFDDLARWSWDLHNAVNAKLGRPHFPWINFLHRYYPDQVPYKWRSVEGARVGFVTICFSEIGGTETFATTLVPRLANVAGFAVESIIEGKTEPLGVPTYSGSDAIRSLCASSDVIVSWLVNPREFGFAGKVIMLHHGSIADEGQTRSCLAADEIVCVSASVAAHLRTLTNKPVYYIPNAVDPSRIMARNQIDLPAKKLCVWMHRFAKDKRPELAIQIAACLPDDWHMVLAGIGMKLESNERVTILGPQHPGDLLTRASCFLSASKFDGFGLSVAEAIAAGVPVVSTPVGIASEPGLATIVDHDARPQEWAAAIVAAAQETTRPQVPAEYQLDRHVDAWSRVVGFPH